MDCRLWASRVCAAGASSWAEEEEEEEVVVVVVVVVSRFSIQSWMQF